MSDSESEVVRSARRGLSEDDINNQDKYGWTKLMRAAFRGEHEECQRLIQAGADLNIRDNDGHSALYWACYRDNAVMIKQLSDNGADGGLHISIELYHGKEVLETLLNSSGCDVNKVKIMNQRLMLKITYLVVG